MLAKHWSESRAMIYGATLGGTWAANQAIQRGDYLGDPIASFITQAGSGALGLMIIFFGVAKMRNWVAGPYFIPPHIP